MRERTTLHWTAQSQKSSWELRISAAAVVGIGRILFAVEFGGAGQEGCAGLQFAPIDGLNAGGGFEERVFPGGAVGGSGGLDGALDE